MIEPGMLVENPLKPEWGPGKVLRLEGSVAVVIFRDDPDRAPKRFRSEFLTSAKSQADPELDLIQVGVGGGAVARKTRTGARGARTHDAAEERAKLSWLGAEGDELWRAFQLVFGAYGKAFGSAALGHGGLSDGNEGVQWNSTLFPTTGERRVGVDRVHERLGVDLGGLDDLRLLFDLRVEDNPHPVEELKRLVRLQKASNRLRSSSDACTGNFLPNWICI